MVRKERCEVLVIANPPVTYSAAASITTGTTGTSGATISPFSSSSRSGSSSMMPSAFSTRITW